MQHTAISKEVSREGQIAHIVFPGWECVHCNLKVWKRDVSRLAFHLAGDVGLRDAANGFAGIGLCPEINSDVADRELELELIQTQMTQKPMLRAEVYARALRASQNRKEDSS